ncbi:coiled-coil domain-containing protein 136-like [Leptopilina heterotoma]|uniref:coiled-coil domain-containing protein 136-like n=1 Tax=Leptopilina heterotoma TaxID=63436 RepID=UPI001CA83907|nr:coiled-coil domain-containing protein 136-like [Leptopilina heterotoma]
MPSTSFSDGITDNLKLTSKENIQKRLRNEEYQEQPSAKKAKVDDDHEIGALNASDQEEIQITIDQHIPTSDNHSLELIFEDLEIDSKTITFFERLTEWMRNKANQPIIKKINEKERPVDDTQSKTQLKKGLPVYVSTSKLIIMQRLRNKPNDLARALLIELVGDENLKEMCAKGRRKRGRPAVPADIREAILYYVQRKKSKNTDDFKEKHLTKLINNTCGTLRHPRCTSEEENDKALNMRKNNKNGKEKKDEMDEEENDLEESNCEDKNGEEKKDEMDEEENDLEESNCEDKNEEEKKDEMDEEENDLEESNCEDKNGEEKKDETDEEENDLEESNCEDVTDEEENDEIEDNEEYFSEDDKGETESDAEGTD